MSDQRIYSSDSKPENAAARLESLQRQQDALWIELRTEDDPDRRMALLSQFGENRGEIEELSKSGKVSTEPAADTVAYRVEVLDDAAPDPALKTTGEHTSQKSDERDAPADGYAALSFNDDGELIPEPIPQPSSEQSSESSQGDTIDLHVEWANGVAGDRVDAVGDVDDEDQKENWEDLIDLDIDSDDDDPEDETAEDAHADETVDDEGDLPDEDETFEGSIGGSVGPDLSSLSTFGAMKDDPGPPDPAPTAEHVAVDRRRRDPRPPGPRPAASPPPTSGPSRPRPSDRGVSSPRVAMPRAADSNAGSVESPARILLVVGGVVALVVVGWLVLSRLASDDSTNVASDVTVGAISDAPAGPRAEAHIEDLAAALRNGGFDGVSVEQRDAVIYLSGTVATDADRDAAMGMVGAMAPEMTVDASALVSQEGPAVGAGAGAANGPSGRAEALQSELRRVVAATPIIFGNSETNITDLHARILNSIASIMMAYPEVPVTVVGFTDESGSDDSNREISLSRAENVKAYLVGQGVAESNLTVDALGEVTSTGSRSLANLERRVEFEVADTAGGEAAGSSTVPIRIAIVAPSARNDLAFTQSMVDALQVVAAERGNMEVAVTDNTFVPDEAAAAVRTYADQGYDLVIAHGSQFGAIVAEVAPQYPDVVFAWGTASDNFGLPNVYSYDAKAEQGGYVQGALAGLLTNSGVIGVVGPIEVGDAQLYVNGFRAGAISSRADANLAVTYTGSFSDLTLAAETARAHVAAGADVMTGSAQMVVGAVSVAGENGTLWFGTQANQTSLAPSLVVASQVYHWEVILRPIVADIDAGTVAGTSHSAELANGGLVIEYNPEVPVPDEVRARADEIMAGIVGGSIVVPVG